MNGTFQRASTATEVQVEPTKTVSAHLLEELSQEIEHVENLAGHLEAAANRLVEPNLSHGEGDCRQEPNEEHPNFMNDLSFRISRLREARERLESINAQIERAV